MKRKRVGQVPLAPSVFHVAILIRIRLAFGDSHNAVGQPQSGDSISRINGQDSRELTVGGIHLLLSLVGIPQAAVQVAWNPFFNRHPAVGRAADLVVDAKYATLNSLAARI